VCTHLSACAALYHNALQYFEAELLEMKFEKIMALLRELPKHVDAQRLMEVWCTLHLVVCGSLSVM
jgi:hypothetical protein